MLRGLVPSDAVPLSRSEASRFSTSVLFRRRGPSPLEETRRDLGAAEQRLREATGRVRRSEQHLTHADVVADEVAKANRARAAEIVAYHRGLMAVYCTANLRARGAPEVPPVLRDLPAIAVPSALREPEVAGPLRL